MMGSALRLINTGSGDRSKSTSVDIGPNHVSTFTSGDSLVVVDSTKSQISCWPLATMAKQPPRKLAVINSLISEGATARVANVSFYDDGRSGESGWIIITERMQWPLFKATSNPSFYAGMSKVVRLSGAAVEVSDFWAHAATIADVPVQGQWRKLLCYADRQNPQDHVRRYHFLSLYYSPPARCSCISENPFHPSCSQEVPISLSSTILLEYRRMTHSTCRPPFYPWPKRKSSWSLLLGG